MSVCDEKVLTRFLGRRMVGLIRHVLGLGESNDRFGHGISECVFENGTLTVSPGPNEDFIQLDGRPPDRDRLSPDYWTSVDFAGDPDWCKRHLGGTLTRVELYTDGNEDAAVVLYSAEREPMVFVLEDTDLNLRELPGVLETKALSLRQTLVIPFRSHEE